MRKKGNYTQQGYGKQPSKSNDGVLQKFLPFEKYRHFDPDLEEAVLGICLLVPAGMSRIRRVLASEMFYYDFHRTVYTAMASLFDSGLPIDILIVVNWLFKNKDEHIELLLSKGENVPWRVAKMTNAVVSDAHTDYWAYLIREQYIERKLLELTTAGLGDGTGWDELTRIHNRVTDLMQFKSGEDDWVHVSTHLVRLWQHMVAIQGKDIVGLPSGFKYFDQITSGITPGLYYLGARPSVGKTAFAIKMILNMASNGDQVGIISLETPGIKLAARLLSMISEIDFWRIWRNKMSDELSAILQTYTGAAMELPIWVADEPAVNITDIRAKTWQLVRRGAKCVFIDYLQLVIPGEDAGTREQEVAKLSRGLKLLSMQTNIPIIALAQLSRESEKRTDKTPRLIDLRESGSLEQDADGVMLLHRPEKSGQETDEDGHSLKGKAQLIVAKWRDGETFDHPLLFNGDKMEFKEDEFAIIERRGWDENTPREIPNAPTAPPRDFTEPKNGKSDDDDPF
jgi:replicative DNA helicase